MPLVGDDARAIVGSSGLHESGHFFDVWKRASNSPWASVWTVRTSSLSHAIEAWGTPDVSSTLTRSPGGRPCPRTTAARDEAIWPVTTGTRWGGAA
jgi:hypothetical protein